MGIHIVDGKETVHVPVVYYSFSPPILNVPAIDESFISMKIHWFMLIIQCRLNGDYKRI
jgi:hypothetical protein